MKTVLVADASPLAQVQLRSLLAPSGYRLLTANDGDEALARSLAERPDLILLDAELPPLDGFGTCSLLRTLPPTRVVPIVLALSRCGAESLRKGYSAGCTDYLPRPFCGPELLRKLRSLLGP